MGLVNIGGKMKKNNKKLHCVGDFDRNETI